MPVTLNVVTIGTYEKREDYSTVPNVLPNRLKKSIPLKEKLETGMDLSLGENLLKAENHLDRHRSCMDFLKKTNKEGSALAEATNADFMANRRILYEIAKTPYNFFESNHTIQAVRKNGVIFLCEKDREERFNDSLGHKFEQYLTLDKNGAAFDKEADVTNAECIKGVFRATVSNGEQSIRVFYAAELDAIDNDGNFVEIKTTQLPEWKWWQNYSLKNYLQATFGNTPKIIYGHRLPKTSIVDFITEKKTSAIPETIPSSCRSKWTKEKCFETLFRVLSKIKSTLSKDGDALLLTINKNQITFGSETADNCEFLNNLPLNHFV